MVNWDPQANEIFLQVLDIPSAAEWDDQDRDPLAPCTPGPP